MALSDLQTLRLKISDTPSIETYEDVGDGQRSAFVLPDRVIYSGSALVHDAQGRYTATGATLESGMLTFSGVISANSAFMAQYVTVTFSDDEVQQFLDDGGSVIGGAIEAVQSLLFDTVKRVRWMAPDGTQYDDTQAKEKLAALLDKFNEQQEREAFSSGGIVGWGENQGGYI